VGKSIFFDDSKKKIAERGKNYQKLKNCSNGFRNGDFRPEKTAGMEVTQVRRGRAGRACGSSSRWVRIQLMVSPISALKTATHTITHKFKKGGFVYFCLCFYRVRTKLDWI
jgi:hypothetical protein